MSETLNIPQTDNKEEKYRMLLPQLESLIGAEKDLIANLANTAAALHQTFGFFWVGFYLIRLSDSFGSVFIWLKRMNWYWVLFRGLLPVRVLITEKAFAARLGKSAKQSLCPM